MQVIRTALLGAAITTAVLAPSAQGAAKADLTVTKLSAPPSVLHPGAALTVRDTVTNAGRARTKRTTVTYWLSLDARRNRSDLRIGSRTLKPLKARRSARGRARLSVPAAVAPGIYRLLACADGAGKVRERSERNNCRASSRSGTVQMHPDLVLPPAPPAPTATPAPQPSATPTPAPTATPGEPQFPLPPDPLAVTHALEPENAVTGEVFPVGGRTITTTADDGTEYTLVIPSSAVVSPVDVTLTPVKSIEGSPLGDLIGAVEILPHGLQLFAPATLTIDPPGDGTPADATGFLSHEEGEDFHLYPAGTGDAITMKLTHFSTPGAASASSGQLQNALEHPPIRDRAQMEQLMGEALREARDAGQGVPGDRIAALMGAYYRGVIGPLVQQARTDDALSERAVGELLSWARHVDLYSLGEHAAVKAHRDAVWDNIAAIIDNAIKKGYVRCVDDHDIDYIVRLVRLARVASLLGLTLGDEAFDKAQRCARFEVAVDSLITMDVSIPGTQSWHRGTGTWRVGTPAARIPIDMTFINLAGSLSYKTFDYEYTLRYPDPDCTREQVTTDVSTTPDNSVWFLLRMDLNLREYGTLPPADRDIRLRVANYGDLAERYHTTTTVPCGGATTDHFSDRNTWRDEFGSVLGDEEMRNWQVHTGSELIATWEFNEPRDNSSYAETSTAEIWHTPAK